LALSLKFFVSVVFIKVLFRCAGAQMWWSETSGSAFQLQLLILFRK